MTEFQTKAYLIKPCICKTKRVMTMFVPQLRGGDDAQLQLKQMLAQYL